MGLVYITPFWKSSPPIEERTISGLSIMSTFTTVNENKVLEVYTVGNIGTNEWMTKRARFINPSTMQIDETSTILVDAVANGDTGAYLTRHGVTMITPTRAVAILESYQTNENIFVLIDVSGTTPVKLYTARTPMGSSDFVFGLVGNSNGVTGFYGNSNTYSYAIFVSYDSNTETLIPATAATYGVYNCFSDIPVMVNQTTGYSLIPWTRTAGRLMAFHNSAPTLSGKIDYQYHSNAASSINVDRLTVNEPTQGMVIFTPAAGPNLSAVLVNIDEGGSGLTFGPLYQPTPSIVPSHPYAYRIDNDRSAAFYVVSSITYMMLFDKSTGSIVSESPITVATGASSFSAVNYKDGELLFHYTVGTDTIYRKFIF